MRIHFAVMKVAIIKKKTKNRKTSVGEDVKKSESLYIAGGNTE